MLACIRRCIVASKKNAWMKFKFRQRACYLFSSLGLRLLAWSTKLFECFRSFSIIDAYIRLCDGGPPHQWSTILFGEEMNYGLTTDPCMVHKFEYFAAAFFLNDVEGFRHFYSQIYACAKYFRNVHSEHFRFRIWLQLTGWKMAWSLEDRAGWGGFLNNVVVPVLSPVFSVCGMMHHSMQGFLPVVVWSKWWWWRWLWHDIAVSAHALLRASKWLVRASYT